MISKSIALHEPWIRGNEWKYVKECLDTNWVSSAGKYVELFENKIAEYTGSKYAIACANGTAALQVSLRLAGVLPGDEVIVPTITFIAPVNAINYNSAKPIFMDADEFFCLDIQKTIHFIEDETVFKDKYTYNKQSGKRIAAIVPVHVWGNAAWMEELLPLCIERNIAVIEDASESLGTRYVKGSYVGKHTGTLGLLGCLSFNGNKIITSGGGGMILTDDANLAEKAHYLTTQAKDDSIQYIHNDVGYNYRLTNIQAALGVGQLEQLAETLELKRVVHLKYVKEFNNISGLSIFPVPAHATNNYWLNVLDVEQELFGKDRDTLMQELTQNRIQSRPVWYPNHLQKPYAHCQAYHIDNAERLVGSSLCLPSSSQLTGDDISRIVKILNG